MNRWSFEILVVVIPRRAEFGESPIREDDLRRASLIADKIPLNCFEKPRIREEVALHRFALATARTDDAEAVIDFVIALEALLVPEPQGEVSYRFSMNGARYLS